MEKNLARAFAAKVRRSKDPVKLIADKYGVEMIQTTHEAIQTNGSSSAGSFAIAPWDNAVYVDMDCYPACFNTVEYALHELMHVVCYVPPFQGMHRDRGLDNPDEGDLLMPVERAVAHACFPSISLERILSYQQCTIVWDGFELGEYVDPENMKRWKRGLKIARQLGLLDEDNYPTFERATWNKVHHAVRQGFLKDRWRH